MIIDWGMVAYIALTAVGVIQFAKGLLPGAPWWAWAAALAVVSVGLGAAAHFLPTWLSMSILGMAIAQIGYETIVQLIKKKIDSLA
jgi:hypothetical protein